jgi:adenine specific DNA methylase Mod
MELFHQHNLTEDHLRAIRAVGIADAGKGRRIQTSANSVQTATLAAEAKRVLGGYFREFTFAPKRQIGWMGCQCNAPICPGTVLDPFMGTGTTLKVADKLGFSSFGIDLTPPVTL